MSKYTEILEKHWGYPSFREKQEEIVEAVGSGKDVLGLLPTGGGKSITFQVPALATEGICLVVTPLIALMKDQVENLRQRGIKAMAVYSGMTRHEMKVAFDNAAYGNYKFLYLSPERLGTKYFQEQLGKLQVNLLAIDEAHCISQWGYDFRPSYLKIADIRSSLPNVPVLALTATATPKVVNDIMEKLAFREKLVFQKSFERKNLAYVVRQVDDKQKHLLKIIQSIPGTGVVYVRNRKATREVAQFLNEQGFSADFYHAGLSAAIRDRRQADWKEDRTRIIVSTNAFGMGIDKPDVRFVVHLDLPDSLEAYFQEAGRGGRDGEKAYAVLLYNKSDEKAMKMRFTKSFPPRDKIKEIYQLLSNYLQVALGEGKNQSYEFDFSDFIKKFKLDAMIAFHAIKFLEQEGYLSLSDDLNNPSRLIFLVERDDLYRFQVANIRYDTLIKLILRSYTGLFNDYIKIDESFLASKLGISRDELYEMLKYLTRLKIINYIPSNSSPLITYLKERLENSLLYLSKEHYDSRKKNYADKLQAALHYANNPYRCRSQMLLEYFGDESAKRCGQCDYCLRKTEHNLTQFEYDSLIESIHDHLSKSPQPLEKLVDSIDFIPNKSIQVIRYLIDEGQLRYRADNCLELTGKLFS